MIKESFLFACLWAKKLRESCFSFKFWSVYIFAVLVDLWVWNRFSVRIGCRVLWNVRTLRLSPLFKNSSADNELRLWGTFSFNTVLRKLTAKWLCNFINTESPFLRNNIGNLFDTIFFFNLFTANWLGNYTNTKSIFLQEQRRQFIWRW